MSKTTFQVPYPVGNKEGLLVTAKLDSIRVRTSVSKDGKETKHYRLAGHHMVGGVRKGASRIISKDAVKDYKGKPVKDVKKANAKHTVCHKDKLAVYKKKAAYEKAKKELEACRLTIGGAKTPRKTPVRKAKPASAAKVASAKKAPAKKRAPRKPKAKAE